MCNDDLVRRLVKTSLLLFNLLLAGLSSGGLALGLALSFAKKDALKLAFQISGADASTKAHVNAAASIASLVTAVSLVFCVVGGVGLMMASFGCIGACCERVGLLRCYAILICGILLLTILMVAGLFLLVSNKGTNKIISNELFELQSKYYLPVVSNSSNSRNHSAIKLGVTHIIDSVQLWFQCCGMKNTDDATKGRSWSLADKTWQGKQLVRPATCCRLTNDRAKDVVMRPKFDMEKGLTNFLKDPDCPFSAKSAEVHNTTCPDAVVDYLSKYRILSMVLASALIGAEISVITLACCLVKFVNEEDEDYDYYYDDD